MNIITPEVKSSLSKYKDAKRLWDTLKERFALVSGPRIQQLKASIARCEQTKGMIVAAYYGKLKTLWEELHSHEPLITYTCYTRCTVGRKHETRREKDKLHEFLMGLNGECFVQIRSNILSQDLLPSLNRAYQMVIQDERVRTISNVTKEKPEVMSFAIRTSKKGRDRNDQVDKNKCYCTHCYGGSGPRANVVVVEYISFGFSSEMFLAAQAFTAEQLKALTSVFGNMSFSNDHLSGSSMDNYGSLIQDQMRALHGMGSKQDELYYFEEPSLVKAIKVNKDDSSFSLWHSRTGHPYEKVLKYLPMTSSSKDYLNKACEVCFKAKHPRDLLPLSEHNSNQNFEIIHMDLWGAYKHMSSCGAK
ncbi:hypothetical protein Lser_V15G32929 [Lactuca serriola]